MTRHRTIPEGGAFLFLKLERPLSVTDIFKRLGFFSAERFYDFEVDERGCYVYNDSIIDCFYEEHRFKEASFVWKTDPWVHLSELWSGILTEQIDFLVHSQGAPSGAEAVLSTIPEAVDIIWGVFNDTEEGLFDLSILLQRKKVLDFYSSGWKKMSHLFDNLSNASLTTKHDISNSIEPDEELRLFWSIVKCMGANWDVKSTEIEGYILEGMGRHMYNDCSYVHNMS